MKYITTVATPTGARSFEIEILDAHHVKVDGRPLTVNLQAAGDPTLISLLLEGGVTEAEVAPYENGGAASWEVRLDTARFVIEVEAETQRRLRLAVGAPPSGAGELKLLAPMPGLVLALPVGEGQIVRQGDVLVVLESMKMQNEIKSPRDGRVTRLQVQVGARVAGRQPLLTLE
jgi:biotin carboxyl carrier protein